MNKSTIEWLRTYHADGTFTNGHVWNMVTGCDKVSQGCKHCYAETMATRFWGEKGKGINKDRKFTDVRMHPEKLPLPLKHKTPTRVFVNSMSDLFHNAVPFTFIREVFDVMEQTPHITYILLTKRPKQALQFAKWMQEKVAGWKASENVQIGVSAENQETANERIPELLKFPAHYHIVSCEPLLGLIGTWLPLTGNKSFQRYDVLQGKYYTKDGNYSGIVEQPKISWVIAGGESGHGARPMHPDWVRSLRDQCAAAQVPFFFKQWGAYTPLFGKRSTTANNEVVLNPDGKQMALTVNPNAVIMLKGKPEHRLLDGREHNDYIQPPLRKLMLGAVDLESTFENLKY